VVALKSSRTAAVTAVSLSTATDCDSVDLSWASASALPAVIAFSAFAAGSVKRAVPGRAIVAMRPVATVMTAMFTTVRFTPGRGALATAGAVATAGGATGGRTTRPV